MSSSLERGLSILELLSAFPEGLLVSQVATAIDMPASGTHRILNQLVGYGYVYQDVAKGAYVLRMKFPALALSYLAQSGVTEIVQPILDRLAMSTKQLVRLSIADGKDLVFVDKAQGATSGLRYDPGSDKHGIAHLASSASGLAWLSTFTDDEALMKVAAEGFSQATSGPGAITSASQLMQALKETRDRGYAKAVDSLLPGISSIAAPIRLSDGRTAGTISVAGPTAVFTRSAMEAAAEPLKQAAEDLGHSLPASAYFRQSPAWSTP
jgi:IclR family acetate operon transcriptional repressor